MISCFDFDLLSSPLFIIKKLQRERLKGLSAHLKGDCLDLGCGTKPYRGFINCRRYIGIDGSIQVKPEICAGSLDIPFKDNCFDAVICTELLEHLKEPGECLEEIKRVLRPGGYLYLSVPQSWGLHYEPQDYWRFTRYGVNYLLDKHNFRLVKTERVGGFLSLIGQESVDFIWSALKGVFSFLGQASAERIASGFCLGLSLLFYVLGKALDRMDSRYALGWVVLARK